MTVAAAALRTGLQAIRRAPLRLTLTGLGVAVGVWSVTSMLGVAAGAYGEATAVVGRLGAETIGMAPNRDWEGGRLVPLMRFSRDDRAAIASSPTFAPR